VCNKLFFIFKIKIFDPIAQNYFSYKNLVVG
jgi:hypothetical protein